MKATERYIYVLLPQMSDSEKKKPIGAMARMYTFPVILTRWRPSSSVVVLASVCVAMVANMRCHVVRKIAICD